MRHLKRRALAFGAGGMASAATYVDCSAYGSPDITDRVFTALGCEVRIDATQDFLETDPMTVTEAEEDGQTGFFDIDTWDYVAKDEDNPTPGAYDFSGLFGGMVGDVLVVFKKGSTRSWATCSAPRT